MDKISGKNFLKVSLPLFLIAVALISLSLINSGVSQRQTLQQKAAGSIISPKKGVAGGATINTLTQLKASWFFNWGYIPGYTSTSGLNNWDPVLWQKFIPLFYGKTLKADGTPDLVRLANSTVSKLTEICSNTSYCNKGSYYLIGNEPDIVLEDKIPNTGNAPRDAASFQGTIVRAIRVVDPSAKFIVLGLSELNLSFVNSYLTEWKNQWSGTDIASFPDVISGWHFHTFNDNLTNCLGSDGDIRSFIQQVDSTVISLFGKNISNRELWVTEMGALDNLPDPNSTNPTEIARRALLKEKIKCYTNTYEASSVVTRYAWFYLGCNPALHAYPDCGPPKNHQWGRNNLYYPSGSGLTFSDLGPIYAAVPNVVSPTSTPPSHPTTSLTPTPITTSVPHLTGTGTPTPRPTSTLTLTPTVTRAATHSPTPTPTTTLPATCQAATTISLKFCYGQCASCENACGAHACIRVFHPAGAPADPDCANYGGTTTEYTAYKCTDTLPKSICSCTNLPTGNPTPGGATLTPTLALSPTATVTIPPGACPLKNRGDANCDQRIEIADFNIWRSEFLAGTHERADFDGNGIVGISDFNAWRDGFLGR